MSAMDWSSGVERAVAASKRSRWLGVLEGVLAFGWSSAVLAGLVQVVLTALVVWPSSGPNAMAPTLPVWNAQVSLDGVLAPGVQAAGEYTEVRLHDTGLGPVGGLLYLLTWLPGLLAGGLALWWLFRTLGRSRTSTEELFSATTALTLRRVGWILVIGAVAAAVLGTVARSVLSHLVLVDSVPIVQSELSITMLVSGVAALAVSEVVRRGLDLLDDIRGTI